MNESKIAIIIGSIRQNRFAERAARWIYGMAQPRKDVTVELIDLKEFSLPLFAEAIPPAYAPSQNEYALRWQRKMAEFDDYIFTAAEYNHGPTAVLKNALDHAYAEWRNKPVAFVGYGGVGGARAIEQLRLHAIELQMAPIRSAVHILWPDFSAALNSGKDLSDFPHLNQGAQGMLDQLVWWSNALKSARERSPIAA